MNRPESWSRHSYPLQSANFDQKPAHETSFIPKDSAPPKLPKAIRAVKDADNYHHKGRTLIVCLDGTGDKFDNDNSNIVHLVGCLKKDDPSQVTYYQSGIGTYDGKGLRSGFSAGLDMAVGSGLGVHIQDAYKFLMETYRESDKICLFGFSRGAYTARCLAGMLHKVGLLPAHNSAQVPFAYQFYKDDSSQGWKMSAEFKKTFCIDASVYFVGVWDCVASVGFIPRKLPFSSTPTSKTGHFRHAMALDEHRSKFKTLHWQKRGTKGQEKTEKAAGANSGNASGPQSNGSLLRRPSTNLSAKQAGLATPQTNGTPIRPHAKENGKSGRLEPDAETQMRMENQAKQTDVLEVWFTGAHADVGGGAVANEFRHKLSQIPLRWMLRQCFECDTGVLFYTSALAEQGLDVHTLWPMYARLPKPVVGPSPKMMEKYESGDLGPISRRSTHVETKPEKHISDKEGIKVTEEEEKEEKAGPVGEWVPEQVEDYFDAMAPINDQLVQARSWWILELWPIKVKIQRKGEDEWEKKVGVNWGRYRPVQDLEPNLHWTVKQRSIEKGYKMQTRMDRNAIWKTVV